MYKRSEITAHGTRDYFHAKWKANFPNTGFWTYIKYTIVDQHTYRNVGNGSLACFSDKQPEPTIEPLMGKKDQALIAMGR